MSTGILVLTDKALIAGIRLKKLIEGAIIYAPEKLNSKINDEHISFYDKKFSECVYDAYNIHDSLIFIMATGIVVRSLMPLIKDKVVDPAVIVMDENLEFCISLLGGHVAGANKLAQDISLLIGCTPVITTATDVNKKGALDLIAKKLGAYNVTQRDLYKKINFALASSRPVHLLSDFDMNNMDLDIRGFEQIDMEKALSLNNDEYLIHIRGAFQGDKKDLELITGQTNYHEIKPEKLVLGIGCRRNTSFKNIKEGLEELCNKYLIDKNAIKIIASIDLKKDEIGILTLATYLNAEFVTFDKDELSNTLIESESIATSDFVKDTVGVGSVSEASAYHFSRGNIILTRQVFNKVTYSLGIVTL